MQAHVALLKLRTEVAKFGSIGLIGYIIDVGVFNWLRFGGSEGLLHTKPLTAKVISTIIATLWTYFGNRYWTFRHRQRTSFRREYVLFFALNGVGMLIAVGFLFISHYALGLDSQLADNISANGFGLVFGTLFRFWSYRKWVFLEHPELPPEHPEFSAITP